jgi:hypothetical protein
MDDAIRILSRALARSVEHPKKSNPLGEHHFTWEYLLGTGEAAALGGDLIEPWP